MVVQEDGSEIEETINEAVNLLKARKIYYFSLCDPLNGPLNGYDLR
jgi:hypothetical protein